MDCSGELKSDYREGAASGPSGNVSFQVLALDKIVIFSVVLNTSDVCKHVKSGTIYINDKMC